MFYDANSFDSLKHFLARIWMISWKKSEISLKGTIFFFFKIIINTARQIYTSGIQTLTFRSKTASVVGYEKEFLCPNSSISYCLNDHGLIRYNVCRACTASWLYFVKISQPQKKGPLKKKKRKKKLHFQVARPFLSHCVLSLISVTHHQTEPSSHRA